MDVQFVVQKRIFRVISGSMHTELTLNSIKNGEEEMFVFVSVTIEINEKEQPKKGCLNLV